MLQRLNPLEPTEIEARGFIAPYIRIATHLGFDIAWVSMTSDEDWDTDAPVNATRIKILSDLQEVRNHLDINDSLIPSAFVNEVMVTHMLTLKEQITDLINNLPTERPEILVELQTLNNNLAYVGAQLERHLTGSTIPDEGKYA